MLFDLQPAPDGGRRGRVARSRTPRMRSAKGLGHIALVRSTRDGIADVPGRAANETVIDVFEERALQRVALEGQEPIGTPRCWHASSPGRGGEPSRKKGRKTPPLGSVALLWLTERLQDRTVLVCEIGTPGDQRR